MAKKIPAESKTITAGILNPSAYRTSKGISKGGSKSTLEPTKWNRTTVKKILTLQEYCGDVINFKSYSKSYKMKKRIENSEENRAIFLNVHTPHESRFKMLSEDYEKEQEELRQKIVLLEEEIQKQEDQVENVDKFIRQTKKYLHFEKLTPTVLNDMVNAVYVHAPDKSSGHRVQDVDISYNYIGILPANLLYNIINGEAA